MRNLFVFVTLLFVGTVFSQRGKIQGKITDKDMASEPLPFVTITVQGASKGTNSDFEGNYTLELPEGTYTLEYTFIGYAKQTKVVKINGGTTTTQNIEMASSASALKSVIIKVETNKESDVALVAQQKEATVIVESVGAQQLSSQGVSDAAAATVKVTGVSKQQGSSKVYVRGLGDRYNITTLNGLPLPSNDPSTKNISLDLFSTDVLQNVGISKTFSSLVSGDLSGANINIETKKPSSKPQFSIGFSTGVNSQTTFKDFRSIDGANFLGIASETNHPITSLRNYAFSDNMSPNSSTALPKIGLSINGGKKVEFDNGHSFSYFLVGGFSNNYRFVEGKNTNNITETRKGTDFYDAKEYSYSADKLLMGNFEYEFSQNHKLLFNTLLIYSNSQKIQDYFGNTNDNDNVNLILQTQRQNRLLVNQILSKHSFGEKLDINFGLAFNNIKNDEPNRKKNIFIIDPDTGNARFSTGVARNNSRYYHNLSENDLAFKMDGKYYLGAKADESVKGKINFGYSFRNTDRSFEAIYFDHDRLSSVATVDREDLSETLNQEGIDNGSFRLTTGLGFGVDALKPFTYDGAKLQHAVSSSLDYDLTESLFLNFGLRFEYIDMKVNWFTNLTKGEELEATINKTYILPSLNLKYKLNDDNQLRLSASQTYTFPQFKEIAEFVYEGANYQDQGNEKLKPSDNYNLDIKYENFPENGGVISATVFGKIIRNSINRIELNAEASNSFSYENTGDASVYGLEVEYKTDLYNFQTGESSLEKTIKLGVNGTYMYTNQEFNSTRLFVPTNSSAQLEGAAPFIFNGDISYDATDGDKSSIYTLVFNYQHDKLYSIGSRFGDVGLENIVQKAIATLDFVVKHKFNKHFGIKGAVKNILNPKFERVRDLSTEVVNISYRRGVDASFSVTYNF